LGFIFGGIAGFVIGLIEAVMGASREEAISASRVAGSVAGVLVGLTCTIVAVRWHWENGIATFDWRCSLRRKTSPNQQSTTEISLRIVDKDLFDLIEKSSRSTD